MMCPATLEKYDYGLQISHREYLGMFGNSLHEHNIEHYTSWSSKPNIWFKTDQDLNVAKLLL